MKLKQAQSFSTAARQQSQQRDSLSQVIKASQVAKRFGWPTQIYFKVSFFR
jgi:hypothetical protein